MADLVAADVTYTPLDSRATENGRRSNRVRLAFGDGVDTVPAGGIPLTKGKMGCPNIIESLVVVDQGTSGYKFQYDQSAEKLVVMQTATATTAVHSHSLHLNDGDVSDGATTRINAGANLLGANTGGDLAIAGVANTSGVGGIVQAAALTSAAAALTEASTVTIAAQTIEVEVIGW